MTSQETERRSNIRIQLSSIKLNKELQKCKMMPLFPLNFCFEKHLYKLSIYVTGSGSTIICEHINKYIF